jgi:hypothetical protein
MLFSDMSKFNLSKSNSDTTILLCYTTYLRLLSLVQLGFSLSLPEDSTSHPAAMSYNNQPLYPGQNAHALDAILANLPGRHGTHSNPSRNVRRRLHKKWGAEAKTATAAGVASPSTRCSIDANISVGAACGGPRYPLYNIPCQREPPFLPDIARDVTVYHAHIDPSQFPRKSGSAIPPSHDQEQTRGERQGSAQRRDSRENRRLSNPLSPPQDKPALSANSTSAEIVEALMPDRPAPVRFPRRTASVRYCEERKIALKISISAEFGKRRA